MRCQESSAASGGRDPRASDWELPSEVQCPLHHLSTVLARDCNLKALFVELVGPTWTNGLKRGLTQDLRECSVKRLVERSSFVDSGRRDFEAPSSRTASSHIFPFRDSTELKVWSFTTVLWHSVPHRSKLQVRGRIRLSTDWAERYLRDTFEERDIGQIAGGARTSI